MSVLRLLGAICVMLACAGLGKAAAELPVRRRELLNGAQQGLLALLREIEFATPLSLALPAAAEYAGSCAPVFRKAGELLSDGSGRTADEAWRQALHELSLKPEDQRLLAAAGEGLGCSNSREQCRQLELLRQKLSAAEEQAAAEIQRCGRLRRTVGWCCGAMLTLLLL